jgi:hypothetical protein
MAPTTVRIIVRMIISLIEIEDVSPGGPERDSSFLPQGGRRGRPKARFAERLFPCRLGYLLLRLNGGNGLLDLSLNLLGGSPAS